MSIIMRKRLSFIKYWKMQNHKFPGRIINASKRPRGQGIDLCFRCNNRCIFCYDNHKRNDISDKPLEQAKKDVLALKKKGINIISLRGSEPTIYPHIYQLVSFINNHGLKFRMTTNARIFSYVETAKKFASLGLDNVYVSLHSHKADIHDKLTQTKGSFDQTLKGIKNLLASGVRVETNTTILKQNVEDLPKITQLLSRYGLFRARFSFLFCEGVGLDIGWWKKLMPSIAETRESLSEAMNIFQVRGIYSFIEKLPICGAPQYYRDFKPEDYVIAANIKPEICQKCAYHKDNYCVGVSPMYLKMYGEKDLIPQ